MFANKTCLYKVYSWGSVCTDITSVKSAEVIAEMTDFILVV